MDEVNQITFFRSYFESVENLDAETYKECMNVILKYIFRGEEPEKLSPTAKMFWTLTKPSIDKSLHKRNNVKDDNQSEDKPDSNQSQTEIKSNSNGSQTEDKLDSNESQNAVSPRNKDKGIGIRTKEQDIKNSPAPSATPSVLEREFESIWAEYPRKQERKDAFAAYCSARKRGTTSEQIAKGVRAYCAYIERNHVDQQYVKQGGTFFRQQGWSDDWSGTFQTARSGTTRQSPDQAFPQRTDDLDALALRLQFAST